MISKYIKCVLTFNLLILGISNCWLIDGKCIEYDGDCNLLVTWYLFQPICQPINCPSGYVQVPCNFANSSTRNFCVAQYEMKIQADNNGDQVYNSAFTPESRNSGTPWTQISQTDAKLECASLGENYHLITNSEWMTIAHNIENVNSNWSSGIVNSGTLNRGHSDNNPANVCDSVLENVDTNCSTSGGSGWNTQKRTHTLSNGEILWDFSGNVWSWSDWQVTFANKAYSSGSCDPKAAVVTFCEWTEIDIYPNDIMKPSTWQAANSTLKSTHGIGLYTAGTAEPGGVHRGGDFGGISSPGIFALSLFLIPSTVAANVGFRCVYQSD